MKGTPVGTRHRRRAFVAVTAAAALVVPGGAEASKIVVSKTGPRGDGSFAAAVRKAERDKDLDSIVFFRRLRGGIQIPRDLDIDRPLHIVGRGFGEKGSGRFRRVWLRGPSHIAVLTFESGTANKGSISGMYLDRVAVSSDGSSFSVRHSHLTGRHDGRETGITPSYAYGDETTIVDSTVVGFRSGGIAPYRSDTTVDRTTVVGNGDFGVASGGETGSLVVKDSTLAGNYGAGAIGSPPADLRIVNSTISGNESYHRSDVAAGVTGEATVLQSTIAWNGGNGGGLSPGEYGSIRVGNSIVAGNQAVGNDQAGQDCSIPTGPDASGEVHSLGGNLIEDPGNCTFAPSDLMGVEPKLGSLRDNGGATATVALRKGSPAIGLAVKKNATKRDQRGVRRGKNPDSGAFERR